MHWFAARLLDWAARCDAAGRHDAARTAFALAAEVGRPHPSLHERGQFARELRAFAAEADRLGATSLARSAREVAGAWGSALTDEGGRAPADDECPARPPTLQPSLA